MKLLIIILSHEFDIKYCDNIKILNDYIHQNSNIQVDYCGISNQNDFHNYETIIQFKYKIINTKYQLSKICDFITDYKSELDYTWYIKTRPEIKLLENINFNILSENAINARARVYYGPSKIKYGMSVGADCLEYLKESHYDSYEHDIILDDMFYIFHNNIVQKNGFNKLDHWMIHPQNEWTHTEIFNNRNINLNVIGIYIYMAKHYSTSGNVNM
jgi:hypothetical protein